MADTKITALTALTAADPANDVIPIVDVSDTTMAASGTTKKISVNNILSSSPTASGALTVTGLVTAGSATITGDLTVRTTGLILNTSGLGVGITPTSFGAGYGTIQVSGATGSGIKMGSPTNGSFIYSDNTWLNILTATNIPHRFFVNNIVQHTIEQLGVFTWADGAGGTRMTLNSTGLGVGASPGAKLDVTSTNNAFNAIQARYNSSNPLIGFGIANSNGYAYLGFNTKSKTTSDTATYEITNTATQLRMDAGQFRFNIAASGTAGADITFTQAMTLNASGNLLVARTGAGLDNTSGVTIGQSSIGMQTEGNATQIVVNRTTSDGTIVDIRRNNVTVGTIAVTTTATAYNTSSDYRLKESAQPLVGGLARVNALKPSVYKWKANGSAGEGFLAHELAETVPFAVTGDKDAVDADGNPTYQGVDLSKIVPILVAAIQELTSRVQTLEAR
jgi:hypothetical protein